MLENIRLSLKGIVSHKMRSALTMLGIIIGIAAVIMIVSIIESTTMSLKESFVGGTNNTTQISLYTENDSWNPYTTSSGGTIPGISTISKKSIQAVNQIDGVEDCTPIYFRNLPVIYNGKSSSGVAYGVEQNYFNINELVLTSGRLLNQRDYDNKNNVVVLSQSMADDLFGTENPIGKSVNISSDVFVVVGVVTTITDLSDVNSVDDYFSEMGYATSQAFVPSAAWSVIAGYDDIQSLVIKVADVDETVNIAKKAANALNSELVVSGYKYKSGSLSEDNDYLETIANIASILLIGIASISLVVGGIGVMNIMLVSVTERTREIGLKKALGAKKKVILAQFLTESVVLTSLGGIIGVLIGIGAAYIISMALELPFAVSVPAIVIAVGFSMGVGILFGLMPSVKASNLDPIEALRYE